MVSETAKILKKNEETDEDPIQVCVDSEKCACARHEKLRQQK
jgi:hypothetical protein